MEVFAEKLSEAVKVMAEKLGVAVEKLYPILIRQAYVEGYISLAWVIFGILGIMICGYLFWKSFKSLTTDNNVNDDDARVFVLSISAFIVIVSIAAVIINIGNAIRALANPEWYAIKMILNLIK